MSSQVQPIRPRKLHVTVACDFNRVRDIAEQVQSFLRAHGCAKKARSDCELAVVEGCNNAIKHTRPGMQGERVTVDVTIKRREIELRVTDHGPGFAWPKRVQLPNADNETGRGLYLISRLMDSARYVRGRTKNTLVLRRRWSDS